MTNTQTTTLAQIHTNLPNGSLITLASSHNILSEETVVYQVANISGNQDLVYVQATTVATPREVLLLTFKAGSWPTSIEGYTVKAYAPS